MPQKKLDRELPAPWWKTDYFEVRYEDPENNKRYFYQLDGEGIRYEIVAFVKAIQKGSNNTHLDQNIFLFHSGGYGEIL